MKKKHNMDYEAVIFDMENAKIDLEIARSYFNFSVGPFFLISNKELIIAEKRLNNAIRRVKMLTQKKSK